MSLVSIQKFNAKVSVTVVGMALSRHFTIKNTSSSVQIADSTTFHNLPDVATLFDDKHTKVS